jgi:hypothetical protein
MSATEGGEGRKVLRRCPHCRLLFEALEGTECCVVCGVAVDGLALPLDADAVPSEIEREPTARLTVPRGSN